MAKISIVWDRTAAFAGERIGVLLPVALALFVVPTMAGACLGAATMGAAPGVRLGAAVLNLLLSLASFWGTLTVLTLATGEASLPAAARLAARRVPAALLVWIALGLAAMVLAAPVPVILAARGYDVAAIAAGQAGNVLVDPQTSALVALGSLLLAALFLFAFARLILTSCVILREGVAFAALRRSWALTRGHGWRIFGTLLLFALVAAIALFAAEKVSGAVFGVFLGTGPGLTPALLLTAIVVACVQAAATLLLAVFQGRLYVALTTRDSVWPA